MVACCQITSEYYSFDYEYLSENNHGKPDSASIKSLSRTLSNEIHFPIYVFNSNEINTPFTIMEPPKKLFITELNLHFQSRQCGCSKRTFTPLSPPSLIPRVSLTSISSLSVNCFDSSASKNGNLVVKNAPISSLNASAKHDPQSGRSSQSSEKHPHSNEKMNMVPNSHPKQEHPTTDQRPNQHQDRVIKTHIFILTF